MLIRNPAEFEHKARQWAVKFAGATPKEVAEGSGGATAESITRKRQEAKQNEEKVKMAAYVHALYTFNLKRLTSSATTATTKTLSIDSSPWASTSRPLSALSSTSALTRWAARITSSRKRTWAISRRDCSARHRVRGRKKDR